MLPRALAATGLLLLLAFAAAPAALPERRVNPRTVSEAILIPAGSFLMGEDGGDPGERPRRRVHLDAFYLDRYEVTNEQFRRFVNATGYEPRPEWVRRAGPGRERHPVLEVNWTDAVAYCRWAGGRLPTEAEWEKAARGTDGRTWPWGDEWDRHRCNTDESGRRDTAPVGSYPQGASPYGVEDMAGNAFEWVQDWYAPYPGAEWTPRFPPFTWKVARGGSWTYSRWHARTTRRRTNPPVAPDGKPSFGFRCAYDP